MNVTKKSTDVKMTGRDLAAGGIMLLALVLLLGASPAASAEPAHHPVNFSLYFPVGTNQDPDISTNFRMSLIYGRVGEVRGVDFNAGVSIIQRDMRGLHATLLYSKVAGDFKGVEFAGLVNNIYGDVSGLQFSGLVNFNHGHMSGLQYASMFNAVEGGFSGAQVSSVLNTNRGDGGFLQLAGLANMNEGDFRGGQIGLFNFGSSHFKGFQAGLFNTVAWMHGLQVGLINMGYESHGVQLGVLNLAHDSQGMPIGLINIDETNGDVDWVVFGSNLAAIGTGVRTTVNRWYSILWAGYGDQQGDVENAGFIGWNYGYSFPIGGKWKLDVDLGFVNIMPEVQTDPEVNDKVHYALQARALLEVRLADNFSAFAGGGVSSIYSEYSSNAQQETEPNVVLGISLF